LRHRLRCNDEQKWQEKLARVLNPDSCGHIPDQEQQVAGRVQTDLRRQES
jgi:hypothetical protein